LPFAMSSVDLGQLKHSKSPCSGTCWLRSEEGQ